MKLYKSFLAILLFCTIAANARNIVPNVTEVPIEQKTKILIDTGLIDTASSENLKEYKVISIPNNDSFLIQGMTECNEFCDYTSRLMPLYLVNKSKKYKILTKENFEVKSICSLEADDDEMNYISVILEYGITNNFHKINTDEIAVELKCNIFNSAPRGDYTYLQKYFSAIHVNAKKLTLISHEGTDKMEINDDIYYDEKAKIIPKKIYRSLHLNTLNNRWIFSGFVSSPVKTNVRIIYDWVNNRFVKSNESFEATKENICNEKYFNKMLQSYQAIYKESKYDEAEENLSDLLRYCEKNLALNLRAKGESDLSLYRYKNNNFDECTKQIRNFRNEHGYSSLSDKLKNSINTNLILCNSGIIQNEIKSIESYADKGLQYYCKQATEKLLKTLRCVPQLYAHNRKSYCEFDSNNPFDEHLVEAANKLNIKCTQKKFDLPTTEDYNKLISGILKPDTYHKVDPNNTWVSINSNVLEKFLKTLIPTSDKILIRPSEQETDDQKYLYDSIHKDFLMDGSDTVSFKRGNLLLVYGSEPPKRESFCYYDSLHQCTSLAVFDLKNKYYMLFHRGAFHVDAISSIEFKNLPTEAEVYIVDFFNDRSTVDRRKFQKEYLDKLTLAMQHKKNDKYWLPGYEEYTDAEKKSLSIRTLHILSGDKEFTLELIKNAESSRRPAL